MGMQIADFSILQRYAKLILSNETNPISNIIAGKRSSHLQSDHLHYDIPIYDTTILPEMDRQLPPQLSALYSLESCLKYTPDKQVYVLREKSTGTKALLKHASKDKAALLGIEAAFLQSVRFDFLPAYRCCIQTEDSVWLVREYIEGETLEEYVEHREPLPVREALFILDQAASLIAALHDQKPPILHRDIKPQNFMFTQDNKLIMLDVETVRSPAPAAEHDTITTGTRSTAAPEQFGYSQTSIQSDIYGLGMLLIYLTTGSYSRAKNNYAFLPFSVRRIIEKCIHFDPSKRYRNIRLLRRDIASVRRLHIRFLPLCLGIFTAVLALSFGGGVLVRHQVTLRNEEQSVVFENPVIEDAARQALGKSDTDRITREDLSQIHSLLLSGDRYFADWNAYENYYNREWFIYDRQNTPTDVFRLDDLQYFTGLRELALDVHRIADLSVLTDLPLEKLCLKKCRLESISSLPAFPGLRHLALADNPLTDISILSELPALEELDLMNTAVSDLRPLEGKGLRSLNCSYTGVTDYSAVSTLDTLTVLRISHADTDTISFVNTLTNLEILALNESDLASLNEISALTSLVSLDLTGCSKITSLEGIRQFVSLDYLCFTRSEISDLTPLTQLNKLTCVEFPYAPVKDLTPLADCPQLTLLYVSRVQAEALDRQLPGHSYDVIIVD